MVQNLLNNLNSISNNLSSVSKLGNDTFTQTDFQKLFDKQKTSFENDKSTDIGSANKEENIQDKDEGNGKTLKSVAENETFAGSVIYDIKQLIEFLKRAADEDGASSDSEENSEIASVNAAEAAETEDSTEVTEDLDAKEIAKKLLHLEEDDDEEKKKETDEKTNQTEQTDGTDLKEVETVNTETAEENLVFNKNLDSFLEEFETAADVQTTTETTKVTNESGKSSTEALEDIINEDQLKELNIESLDAESSDSSSAGDSDLMQNQSPEEQGVKAMLQNDTDFASDLGTSFTNGASTQNGIQGTNAAGGSNTASVEITPSKIIEQITKQMEGMQSGSKLNIVLNPESLGKVSIQLINTKEGLSAQFTVATQDARNLIMKGLDGLKDTLVSHGVSVDNVTVKLNDTQESEYNTDWTEQEGSRGGNKEQNPQREQRDKEQFDKMMSFIENENGKV